MGDSVGAVGRELAVRLCEALPVSAIKAAHSKNLRPQTTKLHHKE